VEKWEGEVAGIKVVKLRGYFTDCHPERSEAQPW